jgi:hypothetical protein
MVDIDLNVDSLIQRLLEGTLYVQNSSTIYGNRTQNISTVSKLILYFIVALWKSYIE